MKNKKTALEIEREILQNLGEGPKTITDLKLKLNSNWQTVEKFLKKLEEEKKVKEVVSMDKKKIYQLITGDTYFEIPITDEERKKFRTLFFLIKREYSKQKINLSRTHFAKAAVDAIKNSKELSGLPTIQYLYGIIPLMVADPTQEYLEEFIFREKEEIMKSIIFYIEKNPNNSAKEAKVNQHLKYNQELHIIADRIFDIILKNWDNEKLLDELNKFYVLCPIVSEFPHVFEFTDKFVSIVNKLFSLNKLEEAKREISFSFGALWKYVATYKAYDSLRKLNRFDNAKIILDFSIGSLLDARDICFEESFQDLHSIYWNSLKENIKFEESEDILGIKEIMQDFIGED